MTPLDLLWYDKYRCCSKSTVIAVSGDGIMLGNHYPHRVVLLSHFHELS